MASFILYIVYQHFTNPSNPDLHKVWDTDLLESIIANTPRNYSKPLSDRKVEGALQGAKYDPFIRRVMWEGVLSDWKAESKDWFSCGDSVSDGLLDLRPEGQTVMTAGVTIDPDTPVVCPHHWAQPVHKLNCDIAWIPEFDEDDVEVDTDEYSGEIERQLILEKLLAQGGLRLAGILNYVFGSKKGLYLA